MINLNEVKAIKPWGIHYPLDEHREYAYARFEINPGTTSLESYFRKASGAIYIVNGDGNANIQEQTRNKKLSLKEGCLVTFGNLQTLGIEATSPLIIQTISSDNNNLHEEKGLYRVDKSKAWGPGGEELWLQWMREQNDHEKGYCFKRIVLPAGRVTSLQFHEKKYETNFIAKGRAKIYRGKNLMDLAATKAALTVERVGPGAFFGVPIGLVHKVEALTDLVLLEASTTHVDDVVRLEDATGRGDGRIKEEHNN